MRQKVVLNEDEIVALYNNGMGITGLCEKFHVGKLKIRSILKNNNVELKKRGGQISGKVYKVSDWKIEKYPKEDGYEYIARTKDGQYECNDYMNNGGYLTSYIKKYYFVDIPTLYDRREYYKETGNYWWEQWFDIVKIKSKLTKKCPYCDWETTDVDNKSGAFEQHLMKMHEITKIDYLRVHQEDLDYFALVNPSLNRMFEHDKNKYVTCAICGKKLARIDSKHLASHGLTKKQYIDKYHGNTVSIDLKNKLSQKMSIINLSIENTYESKAEKDIKYYINNTLHTDAKKDRKSAGTELDIYIPSYKIGIEYDGLYWHTEKHGKDKNYHINKTNTCNEKGIGLIHIFEDEYVLHRDIVFSKIKHILGKDNDLPRIMGRKCSINLIKKNDAIDFLNRYHIQGGVSASLYIGAYYNNELTAVMTLLEESHGMWNLTRFASDYHYRMQGVGSKLLKWFIKTYNPQEIKSFADRRWTLKSTNNLYTNIGFKLVDVLKPDYRYYNPFVAKYTRFHKFGFRKQTLARNYGLPLTMTEKEMTQELGYDRIWDCGLFKYVWKKE